MMEFKLESSVDRGASNAHVSIALGYLRAALDIYGQYSMDDDNEMAEIEALENCIRVVRDYVFKSRGYEGPADAPSKKGEE